MKKSQSHSVHHGNPLEHLNPFAKRDNPPQELKLTGSVIAKTAVLFILLGSSAAFLGYTSSQLVKNYGTVLGSLQELTNNGIAALVGIVLVVVFSGMVATLVRPAWLAAVGYALSAIALVIAWGADTVTMILSGVFFLFSLTYATGVKKKIGNQIHFSAHALVEGQMLLLVVLGIIVSASFGIGYGKDAAARNFIFPPELKEQAMNYMKEQGKATIEKQAPGLGEKEKAAAIEEGTKKISESWTEMENSLKPAAAYIPFFLALMIYMMVISVIPIIGLFIPVLYAAIFPFLRITGFAGVKTENREVQELILT